MQSGGGLVANSCPTLVTPWTIACQAPVSLGFSREEYWSWLPFPSPRNLADPGIKAGSYLLHCRDILYHLSYKGSQRVKVAQSRPTLWDPMDYTIHWLLQARILEWVAFPFSRGSSQPRDRTQVSCIAGIFFICWATISLVYCKVRWRKRKVKARWNFDHCVSVFSLVPWFFFFFLRKIRFKVRSLFGGFS